MGNDANGNGGKDVAFYCYTSSGTGTGTYHSNGQVSYDQCHFEIDKDSLINLGNNTWS